MYTYETTTGFASRTPRKSTDRKAALLASAAAGVMALLAAPAHAFFVTQYETKTQIADFYVPNDGTSRNDIREAARLAVSLHGKRPLTQDLPQMGTLPSVPSTMTIQSITPSLPIQVIMPSCPGAAFVVNAVDNGLEQFDRMTHYTACGFPSAQGWRVTFYANTKAPTSGLKSGALICPLIEKMGMSCDPMIFVQQSINKFEKSLSAKSIKYSLISMDPAIPERTLSADPFTVKPAVTTSSPVTSSLGARVAARRDLSSLGADPADRRRMRQAIEDGDEVLVELYVLAGAIDPQVPDENGKVMRDYARKDSVRQLLKS